MRASPQRKREREGERVRERESGRERVGERERQTDSESCHLLIGDELEGVEGQVPQEQRPERGKRKEGGFVSGGVDATPDIQHFLAGRGLGRR